MPAFRLFILCLCLLALLPGMGFAADRPDRDPQRRTIRIANAWSLTADRREKEIDEKRVKMLTATGKAKLLHGANMIRGPFDVEGNAEVIRCDFAGKKFILSGSPTLQMKDGKGKVTKTITGEAGAVIEVGFFTLSVDVRGAHKIQLPDAPAEEKPSAPPPK